MSGKQVLSQMAVKLVCIWLVCLTTLAYACDKDIKQQLLKMQQQWTLQNTSSYSYEIKKQCFCSPDYTKEMLVHVVDNVVTEAHYLDNSRKVPDEVEDNLLTITEWFDEISAAIDNESGSVTVTYDHESGYPVNISIDRHTQRSDDEFNVVISNVIKQ